MRQIERIEDDRVFRVRTTVLQSLERWPSELIDCNDLSINDGLIRVEASAIRDD